MGKISTAKLEPPKLCMKCHEQPVIESGLCYGCWMKEMKKIENDKSGRDILIGGGENG